MNLKNLIRDVPDFPKKGILFRDISPLLQDAKALEEVARLWGAMVHWGDIDFVAGIESRGFILGMLLATKFQKGFLPIRKAGKLPPPVLSRSYDLEYGKATLELSQGKGRVLIVDDVLATGGTLQAAIDLCVDAGFEVTDVGVLINLTFLNSMQFNNHPVKSLLQY